MFSLDLFSSSLIVDRFKEQMCKAYTDITLVLYDIENVKLTGNDES